MKSLDNPYAPGDVRHELWELAVRRDIEAFVAGDWRRIEEDFIAEGFFGIDARADSRPESWQLGFATLASYRERFLAQSELFRARKYALDPVLAVARTLEVPRIEIDGDAGVLLKRFDGELELAGGGSIPMKWESLFVLRRAGGRMRVAAFVGYLPLAPRG